MHLDVVNADIVAGDLTFSVDIPAAAREALTQGRWDPIAELQEAEAVIAERVSALGYLPG